MLKTIPQAVRQVFTVGILLVCVTSPVSGDTFKRSWPVMGTFAEFESAHDSEALNRRAERAVRALFRRVNRTMSTYRSKSDLSRLNRHAGQHPLKVDPWLVELLRRGKRASRRTERAFSMDVLGYGVRLGLKPGGDSYAIPPHGDRFIEIMGDTRVYLEREGMGLDLGGIAKGYALDRAVSRLHDLGLSRFLLSLGRSVYAGEQPEGSTGWPIKLVGLGVRSLERQFVSVSEQGIRSDTGHIINPRTGSPVTASRRVIVIARSGWTADMASTALMVDPDLRSRLLGHYSALVRLVIREK